MAASSPYQKTLVVTSRGGCSASRRVGYSICEASNPEDRSTAILWFYPMSGSSFIVESAAPSFSHYQASVLSIDRPNVGDTEPLPQSTCKGSVDRIQQHALDVLQVLRHCKIKKLFLVGVCLGHAYAVEVARLLLLQNKNGHASIISLQAMALVAPFVSTACPTSWWLARLGNSVPSMVLSAATHTMTSLSNASLPMFLSPSMVRKLVKKKEQEAFGWNEEDFDSACKVIIAVNQQSSRSKTVEARLGTDPSWQQVCDDFAAVASAKKLPIVIHACRQDKVAPFTSVQWLATECYGCSEGTINEGGNDTTVQNRLLIDERIQSHEVMTMMGGPPRNPVLLHEIARSWKLLV